MFIFELQHPARTIQSNLGIVNFDLLGFEQLPDLNVPFLPAAELISGDLVHPSRAGRR